MRSADLAAMVLIVLSTLGIGCHNQKAAWTGKIETADGVTTVSNPAKPKFENRILVLDEDLSIGEDKGRPESVFSGVGGLAVDEQGRVYAIDSREAVVRVFDQEANISGRSGGAGKGPEKRSIRSLPK
jgi:hypothetical protein